MIARFGPPIPRSRLEVRPESTATERTKAENKLKRGKKKRTGKRKRERNEEKEKWQKEGQMVPVEERSWLTPIERDATHDKRGGEGGRAEGTKRGEARRGERSTRARRREQQ